jgi:hypothetical protein
LPLEQDTGLIALPIGSLQQTAEQAPSEHNGVAAGHAVSGAHAPEASHVLGCVALAHDLAPGSHATHAPLRQTGVPPEHRKLSATHAPATQVSRSVGIVPLHRAAPLEQLDDEPPVPGVPPADEPPVPGVPPIDVAPPVDVVPPLAVAPPVPGELPEPRAPPVPDGVPPEFSAPPAEPITASGFEASPVSPPRPLSAAVKLEPANDPPLHPTSASAATNLNSILIVIFLFPFSFSRICCRSSTRSSV